MIHRISALSGRHPERFLASLGLLWAAGPASLLFGGPMMTACLNSEKEIGSLVESMHQELTRRLRGSLPDLFSSLTTTTPHRQEIAELAERSWTEPDADRIAALFDQTRGKLDREGAVQVLSSDLTLITGKSYTRRSLGEIPYTEDQLAHDLESLLTGAPLLAVSSDKGLRFSVTAHAPRLTTGGEEMELVPIIEHLALAGQLILSPVQRAIAPRGDPAGRRARPERALTWVCNPVPLSLRAIVDLHGSPPAGLTWPRFTAPIAPACGGAKYSVLRTAREGI